VIDTTPPDLSTGPTSILGLLTANIISELVTEGYRPEVISAAVATMVGVYSFALGALKLGWILDFISYPVLNGFISAAAIVIMLGQVDSLFGLDFDSGTANIIRSFFTQLGDTDPATFGVGFSGIVLLQGLQWLGRKWGKKSKIIWFLSISRAAVAILLYTGISYGVNKNRVDNPIFAISEVKADGIVPPRFPDTNLIAKVAGRSIAPLIAAALEHIAIAKAFGARNGYVIDTSQELVYLGTTNFFNSFFSAMPVGGAMSRTAVNSESGVKSPLSGIVTAGFVLLGIYKLTGALFWIPKATLAAIIVTAVWSLMALKIFYTYWRTSFADFVGSQIAFWVTLFVSAESGIEFAVLFSVAYILVRAAFAKVVNVSMDKREAFTMDLSSAAAGTQCPSDVEVFAFQEAILFPNAERVKGAVVDMVMTLHSEAPALQRQRAEREQSGDRLWSVVAEQRVRKLRKDAGVQGEPVPLRALVLDLGHVTRIDVTGIKAMKDLKRILAGYAGKEAEMRIVGLNDGVRTRFERAGWKLVDSDTIGDDLPVEEGVDVVYRSVQAAVWERQRMDEEYLHEKGGN